MPVAVKPTHTFESVADMARALDPKTQADLLYDVERFVRPVSFKPGEVVFERADGTPPDLAARMIRALKELTGELWIVDDTGKGGTDPVGLARRQAEAERDAKRRAHPAFSHPLLSEGAEFLGFKEVRRFQPGEPTPQGSHADNHADNQGADL